jgi:hypothetical protein
MAISLALIIILGLGADYLFRRFKGGRSAIFQGLQLSGAAA